MVSVAAPVLVVDDDAVSCRLMVEMLVADGWAAIGTTDPGDAVERLLEQRYALLVCDLHMPDMQGTDLAAAVVRRHPGMPVLVVSAHPDAEAMLEARALGVGFLTKPFIAEAFLAVVRGLAGGQREGRSVA